jgi:hypothetical protein
MAATKKPFKATTTQERRTLRKVFRVNKDESDQITAAAEARSIDEAEFLRRAALGRRADVDFVTDIVLGLRELTGAIRAMHAEFVAQGIEPPSDELLSLIVAGRAAMLRISK